MTTTPGSLIVMDGSLNLRDLGGWPTADGGTIAPGRLFRSDRLSELTEADLQRHDELGIRTVIDLRYEREVADDPSRLWSAVENHVEIPMGGGAADQKSFIERVFAGEMDEIDGEWVGEAYIGMLTDHATDFGEAISTAVDKAPALFHCTAGKDRTGLFAMLVLSTCGVEREHILKDFDLSNEYRAEKRMAALAPTFAEKGLDVENFRAALGAPRDAMEMAFAFLDREHGGPVNYLETTAGMGTDGVRSIRALLS